MKDMIALIGGPVDEYLFSFTLLPDLEDQLEDFLQSSFTSMMENSPSVRILLIYISTTQNQSFDRLNIFLLLKSLDGFQEGKGSKDSLLSVDLLSA